MRNHRGAIQRGGLDTEKGAGERNMLPNSDTKGGAPRWGRVAETRWAWKQLFLSGVVEACSAKGGVVVARLLLLDVSVRLQPL